MTISKQIFSRLFLPQAVVALLVVSSLSLSAMDWEGEFSPYVGPAEENPVLILKEDGSAPDGYVLVDELLAKKRDLLREKMRITKLAIKVTDNEPALKLYRASFSLALAQDACGQLGDAFSDFADQHNTLIDLLQGSIKTRVLKQELAAPILQDCAKLEKEDLPGLSKAAVSMAKTVGRFDVIAELENREMTQEDISAMRWHKTKKMLTSTVLPAGAVALCVAAIAWPRR
jgi:hypothetical protein